MTKNEYNEYLQSEHWKIVKRNFKKLKINKKCFVCGTKISLQVHHRTYKNLYKEKLTDFIFLCNTHHEEVHQFLKESKSDKITLWNVANIFKKKYINKKEKLDLIKFTQKQNIINKVKPDKLPPLIDYKGNFIGDVSGYKIVG